MKPADQTRDYAYRTYIKPARDVGQEIVRIRCGDIHTALGFANRHPLACAALGAMKFRRSTCDGTSEGGRADAKFQLWSIRSDYSRFEPAPTHFSFFIFFRHLPLTPT
jgi:hypothetical protein